MKQGSESDMIQYHHGFGTWLRNNWGLWKGSRLSLWFNHKGIRHPDDMSGIILRSFWRHLNSKPIKLSEQVNYYKEYWKKALEEEKRETERTSRAKNRISKMMMGASLLPNQTPTITMPQRKNPGLRARYLAAYRSGVLITIRKGSENDFNTPGYFLDLDTKMIHPIKIPEIEKLQSAIVVGKVAYFCGTKGATPIIVSLDNDSRSSLTLPTETSIPQLGTDGANVMAAYTNSIYVLKANKWLKIYCGEIELPQSGPPLRMYGNKVFFS